MINRLPIARISEATEQGTRNLAANGHDFPRELNTIGRVGEVREVVRPFNACGCNAFVSRYVWHEKTLRSEEKLLRYLAGGWTWLNNMTVGVWLMVYCGAQKRGDQ